MFKYFFYQGSFCALDHRLKSAELINNISNATNIPNVNFLNKHWWTKHTIFLLCLFINLNYTDNYDVAKIKMESVTDHQYFVFLFVFWPPMKQ